MEEKRQNIDLKNQAETLCFEAERELSMFEDKVPDGLKNNITNIIEETRQEIKSENFESLKTSVEALKDGIKNLVEITRSNSDTENNSEPMAQQKMNLNATIPKPEWFPFSFPNLIILQLKGRMVITFLCPIKYDKSTIYIWL